MPPIPKKNNNNKKPNLVKKTHTNTNLLEATKVTPRRLAVDFTLKSKAVAVPRSPPTLYLSGVWVS